MKVLNILVICIAIFGFVNTASAEPEIEDWMDDYYGDGNWVEITSTDEYYFSSGGYEATAILVDKISGWQNPTG